MRQTVGKGIGWGRTCLSLCIAVAIVLTGLALPGGAMAQAAQSDGSLALLIAADGQFDALVAGLEEAGAPPLHGFPPSAAIAAASQALSDSLVADGLAARVYRDSVSAQEQNRLSAEVGFAVAAWNSLLKGPTADTSKDYSGGMAGDALVTSEGAGLSGFALDPSLYQQSEYMIGKVAVNIVLMESTGAVDPSAEDWTPAERQLVLQQVVAGLAWWQSMEPRAHLQFVYDDHFTSPLPSSYEPVNRSHSDERLWIAEAMQRLGYVQPSYITAVRQYNRASKQRFGADWAFTVFVVDSTNDADNHFADGYFAYAYIHGPFLVMTSENNGYGAENMASVMAHETGHIFGALDEYAGAGIPPTTIGGYLGVPNGNSAYGGNPSVDSIMKGGTTAYTQRLLSIYAAGQVGWRDSDGDGVLDPVDTTVSATATVSQSETGVLVEGAALEVPCPSPTRNPLSMNVIAAARYRINGGPWHDMAAGDGAFDSGTESYAAALPPAPDGDWAIDVAAWNSSGNAGIQTISLPVTDGVAQVATAVEAAASSDPEDGAAEVNGTAASQDGAATVTAIQYRVDSGTWLAASPTDGSFDGPEETFSLTVTNLCSGTHSFEVRAWTQSPWTQAQVWQQNLEIVSTQSPLDDGQLYVPLVARRR